MLLLPSLVEQGKLYLQSASKKSKLFMINAKESLAVFILV